MNSKKQEIKYISIAEFREAGYLQELNRGFLHPLGLALEIKINDDGTESLNGIWDCRDDPEGINYVNIDLSEKAEQIAAIREERHLARENALGYWQQPADETLLEIDITAR